MESKNTRTNGGKASSVDHLSAGLSALIHACRAEPVADVVPDGWFTALQYAKAVSCSKSTADRRLNAALERGDVEQKAFRILSGKRDGLYPAMHYRAVKK